MEIMSEVADIKFKCMVVGVHVLVHLACELIWQMSSHAKWTNTCAYQPEKLVGNLNFLSAIAYVYTPACYRLLW